MKTNLYTFIGDHSVSNSERWSMKVGDMWHSAPGYGVVQRDLREFKKGETYPIIVRHDGTNRPEGPDYDYRAWIDRYANPPWTSGQTTVFGTTYFATDNNSPALLQKRWFGEDVDVTVGKTAHLHIPGVDIDVDSDNDGQIAPPGSAAAKQEDILEEDATKGKVTFATSGDIDGDDILDFADFGGIAGGQFTPMDITLSANIQQANPSQISVMFDYFASSITGITPTSTAPNGGTLRLWKVDASGARSASDFINSGTSYTAASLGVTLGTTKRFYVEAVQGSTITRPIDIAVNVSGSIWSGLLEDTTRVIAADLEFLNAGGNAARELKVAKWKDAFDAVGAVKANFVDLDPDRFKVRMTNLDKKGDGTVTVKVSTDSNDAAYNDDATELTLTETGANTGVFDSKTQMLMSDDVDDDHQIDGIADDVKDDRSHIVALGAKVKTEYTLAGGNTVGKTAKVPVAKTVKMNVNILRAVAGGAPVVQAAAVQSSVKSANERYAQAGIRFDATINAPVDPPAGVDLTNGLDEFAGVVNNVIQMTDEEKALLGAPALRSGAVDVEVYYVNPLSGGSGGEAFPTSFVPDQKYAHSVIIAGDLDDVFNLAHETGHVLEENNLGHYAGANTAQNLMRSGTSATNTVDASKRLTDDQATDMLASVLAT